MAPTSPLLKTEKKFVVDMLTGQSPISIKSGKLSKGLGPTAKGKESFFVSITPKI
jgi:hypothetical protein